MSLSLKSIYQPFFDNSPKNFFEEENLKFTNLLNDDFNRYCKELKLENEWSKDNSLNIEIKKSLIRSKIRYSKNSIKLINEINKYFKINVKKKLGIVNYFTDVYPMIHLPNDYSEHGSMHCDQIDLNRLITIWHPITDYNYKGISYISSYGFFFMLIAKFLKKKFMSKENFPKFLIKDLNPKYGYTYFWGGGLPHQGNLNSSDSASCVLVIRYTENIHKYEKCYNIEKPALKDPSEETNISFLYEIISKFYEYSLKSLELKNQKINLDNLVDFSKTLLKRKSAETSFALSLLSQRLSKILNKNESRRLSIYLDIFSIISGNENKICQQRLIKEGFSNETFQKLESIF